MSTPPSTGLLPNWLTLLCLGTMGTALMATEVPQHLAQDLASGDSLFIEDGSPLPAEIVQQSARKFTRQAYGPSYEGVGFHVGGGHSYDFDGVLRAADDDACSVIGVHGPDTLLRWNGHWRSDGIYNFPHLILRNGGHIVFTHTAVVDLVMDQDFFTRQLWVGGDGTGVIELAAGFRADHSRAAAVPVALGTIRLGGATLITHDSLSLPSHTRPDGRGGHYQNGHVVFERVPGNRWIIDSSNQVYRAQIDVDTDAVIETRSDLTHAGQRIQALPLPAGVHFTSSGAFRTTAPGVTITKTGPAMLALDGEQSYRPDSHLVIDEGLLRMATDPGLGRAATDAGPHLRMRVQNSGRLHLSAPQLSMQAITLADSAQMWLDQHSLLALSEPLTVGGQATLHAAGKVAAPLHCAGTLRIDGRVGSAGLQQGLQLDGRLVLTPGRRQTTPLLSLSGPLQRGPQATLDLQFASEPQPGTILISADEHRGDLSDWAGERLCNAGRWRLHLLWQEQQLRISSVEAVGDK